ncbi:hypothetical protein S1OALGB6SA_81 [Olavius algarvensis spirochete endosymbiont]|uniref:hypothetical protein n=1 Tax=Olavius algarvensis spirochete endosymbiont TaxID=260710 RepID=UPI00052BE575|nr:hypothetical protein [Olavius algarvensis spirochete endosymbiont]KGM43562.1 hypothetical protein JY97_06460 [Alkalispirochaeta odontotermitis]VDA99019.1 hypothetical protein S1OALGB6SA_81 [Olavius algarvensis spirochete endosymbiont]
MRNKINLDRTQLATICGKGIILHVLTDEKDRVLIRAESEDGGRRIRVRLHENYPGVIVYSLDEPVEPKKSHLKLVK